MSVDFGDRAKRSVFVGNIPFDTDINNLKIIFSQFGQIVSFKIITDHFTGFSKGYGFCLYAKEKQAQSAMECLNGVEYNGRKLRVSPATFDKDHNKQVYLKRKLAEELMQYEEEFPEKKNAVEQEDTECTPFELVFFNMQQIRDFIRSNPVRAKGLLFDSPNMSFSLLETKLVSGAFTNEEITKCFFPEISEFTTGDSPVVAPKDLPASETPEPEQVAMQPPTEAARKQPSNSSKAPAVVSTPFVPTLRDPRLRSRRLAVIETPSVPTSRDPRIRSRLASTETPFVPTLRDPRIRSKVQVSQKPIVKSISSHGSEYVSAFETMVTPTPRHSSRHLAPNSYNGWYPPPSRNMGAPWPWHQRGVHNRPSRPMRPASSRYNWYASSYKQGRWNARSSTPERIPCLGYQRQRTEIQPPVHQCSAQVEAPAQQYQSIWNEAPVHSGYQSVKNYKPAKHGYHSVQIHAPARGYQSVQNNKPHYNYQSGRTETPARQGYQSVQNNTSHRYNYQSVPTETPARQGYQSVSETTAEAQLGNVFYIPAISKTPATVTSNASNQPSEEQKLELIKVVAGLSEEQMVKMTATQREVALSVKKQINDCLDE